jgi:hypothetical protein
VKTDANQRITTSQRRSLRRRCDAIDLEEDSSHAFDASFLFHRRCDGTHRVYDG